MMKKKTRKEISEALGNFSNETYEIMGSHSYAAGYFESMLITLLQGLTAKEQEEKLGWLTKSVEGMKLRQSIKQEILRKD